MAREKKILYNDKDLDIELYGPLFSIAWKQETTYYHIDLISNYIQQACDEIERLWKDPKIGFITVIRPTASLPHPKIAVHLAKALREGKSNMAFSAVLFTGKGIRASLIRSLVSELNYIAKYPYPHQVFGNSEKAADWVLHTVERVLPDWKMNKQEIHEFIRSVR